MKKSLFVLFTFLLFTASPILAGQYVIDPDHTEIGFSVKHSILLWPAKMINYAVRTIGHFREQYMGL